MLQKLGFINTINTTPHTSVTALQISIPQFACALNTTQTICFSRYVNQIH